MKKTFFIAVILISFLNAALLGAEDIRVDGVVVKASSGSSDGCIPCTGQTSQCTYDYVNGSYAYPDDGYYKMGSNADPRWIDNGVTITDNVTGLMWAKDGSGLGCNGGAALSWSLAIDFCNGLDFGGHDDWRLPNVNELLSIVDYGSGYSGYVTVYSVFTNTKTSRYWTSTSVPSSPATSAYIVSIGSTGIPSSCSKSFTAYVRPVRDSET